MINNLVTKTEIVFAVLNLQNRDIQELSLSIIISIKNEH